MLLAKLKENTAITLAVMSANGRKKDILARGFACMLEIGLLIDSPESPLQGEFGPSLSL